MLLWFKSTSAPVRALLSKIQTAVQPNHAQEEHEQVVVAREPLQSQSSCKGITRVLQGCVTRVCYKRAGYVVDLLVKCSGMQNTLAKKRVC
jgi:hypothetical protein